MAIGDLTPVVWRIDVLELKPDAPFAGVVTDLSNLYTSDLQIVKQRNYPDEIRFTLDLKQLEERAKSLGVQSKDILYPYKHKIRCYRNNEFVAQGIVVKVSANLNNQSKNTLEVQCVDTLGLLEKRLIHQDYGEGSWADFAKEVIMDAQHEPNRIYNYAWEGDGTSVDNAWFRGWKYRPGEDALRDFPEWEPNHLYSMYDTCTYNGKFWEAKEHAFYSGETFSESNWTLLGILDSETGDVAGAYAVWREDNEEPGPSGTALGGWGGTSSCHMTAGTQSVNNGGGISSISMAGSTVSTSLVKPYDGDSGAPKLPLDYQEVEYLESTYGKTTPNEVGPFINTGLNARNYGSRFKVVLDFQLDSGISGSVWHTLAGVAYGLDSGTWRWNPQFHIAINDQNKYTLEYPTTNTTTTSAAVLTASTPTSSRTQITVNAIPNTPTMKVDNSSYTGPSTVASGSKYGPPANLTIFARNYANPQNADGNRAGSYCCPMKLYSAQIYGPHGPLRNYVPCYRKSDHEPGLYDTLNGKFYPNGNTVGSFNVGPEVYYANEQASTTYTLDVTEGEHHSMGTVLVLRTVDAELFAEKFQEEYSDILDLGVTPTGIGFSGVEGSWQCIVYTTNNTMRPIIWSGDDLEAGAVALAPWGITIYTTPVGQGGGD